MVARGVQEVVEPQARDHEQRGAEFTHRQARAVGGGIASESPAIPEHAQLVGEVDVAVPREAAAREVGVVGVSRHREVASVQAARPPEHREDPERHQGETTAHDERAFCAWREHDACCHT